MWQEWQDGAESIEHTNNDMCPVCSTPLRPMKAWYIAHPEDITYYTAICPKCKTKYSRCAPSEMVSISPDAEAITTLEERVTLLENTLSRLITWINTQQRQLPAIKNTQTQHNEAPNDTEEFTRRYHYLLQ